MSLAETGYSSDEDVAAADAFGLAKLPGTKKARTALGPPPTTITAAAPHVLSEVCLPARPCCSALNGRIQPLCRTPRRRAR
jgi:hypothetical protein